MLVHEYLSNKGQISGSKELCPSNTPNVKVTTATNSALKVLPPITKSSSQERTSTGMTATLPTRHVTGELIRVENFKKRDLRGGKRVRQSHQSVGKTHIQRHSVLTSNLKTDRKVQPSIA